MSLYFLTLPDVEIAITRVAESTLTLITYAILGLFTRSSGELARIALKPR